MKLVAVATDSLALRNVTRLAAALGADLVTAAELPGPETASPTAVVVDLELAAGLAAIGHSKRRWPKALVVGLVSTPGTELWGRGEAAGCDLVTTRGALTKAAPPRLLRWLEAPGGRRLRLFALDDVAGRLGVVERIEDIDAGPLAVYHIGGEIVVACDTCPHAGARLSYGEVDVDGGIVTCPEHGSRFDVTTGDRVRGPADDGLETFRVTVEDNQVYLELE